MRITKKTILISFFLVFLCVGVVFIPIVKGNEDSELVENSSWFLTGLSFDIEKYATGSQFHDGEMTQATSLKIGVYSFDKNPGMQFYDEASQTAWFLGIAQVDVDISFYTNYLYEHQIWGNGFSRTEERVQWLRLLEDDKWPYGNPWDADTPYYIEYKEYVDIDEQWKVDGNFGFDCNFHISPTMKKFDQYIGTTATGEDVAFNIPEIALAGANVLPYYVIPYNEINYDLDQYGAQYFSGEDATPEWKGLSDAIPETYVSDSNEATRLKLATLGLNSYWSASQITTVGQGKYQVFNSIASKETNRDLPIASDLSYFTMHTAARPELWAYRQKFTYSSATVEVDNDGANAGILEIYGYKPEQEEYRNVGWEIHNVEVKQRVRVKLYVWGTADLSKTEDVGLFLSSPEFVRGDTYWDIAFSGDTGASVLFTESRLQQFFNTAGGKILTWIIVIAVLVGGTFLFIKLRQAGFLGGGGSGGKGGKGPIIFAAKGSKVNYSQKIDDRDKGLINK